MSGCCRPVVVKPPELPEETHFETRLGAQVLAWNATPSVDVQARVAAQGGILQRIVINGGSPVGTNGCGVFMLALSTSDGTSWAQNGRTVTLDAVDPAVGIVGPVVVSCCAPGGAGSVFWTYTVEVP